MEPFVHALLSNAVMATVLAVGIALVARVIRRPALLHSLCLLGLLKLVTPPVLSLPLAVLVSGSVDRQMVVEDSTLEALSDVAVAEVSHESARIAMSAPVEEPRGGWLVNRVSERDWPVVVFAIIAGGAGAFWVLAAVRIVRFQRVLRDFEPICDEWRAHTDGLAERLGMSCRPSVELVPGRVPPMLWTICGRPRLLVPRELWSSLTDPERSALLLHELAHLKRHDHWVRWLELLVCGVYWWLPAAWWLRRSIREAEEQCCDAWVVWAMPRPDGAKTYASALLAALEFVSAAPKQASTAPGAVMATIGDGRVPCLKRRLRMIVRARTPKDLSWAGRVAVMSISALLLPLAPSWAEREAEPSAGVSRADREASVELSPVQVGILADVDDLSRSVGEQLAFLQGPAKKVAPKADAAKGEPELDIAEKFEAQLKDLLAKLGQELTPLGKEVQKSLERAVGEIQKSVDKENISAEELLKAVEKSRDELRRSFQPGGPVDKEVRAALERSRKDAREAMDRARQEIEKARDQLRDTLRSQAEASKEQGRELDEKIRKDLRELARKNEPVPAKPSEKAKELPKLERPKGKEPKSKPETAVASRDGAGIAPGALREVQAAAERKAVEEARKEIRDLEEQLRNATRRLDALQKRETRRGPERREKAERAERPERREKAERAERPERREKAERAEKAERPERRERAEAPAPPARPVRPVEPVRPRGPVPLASPRGEIDRRFRELDTKLDRMLKELEQLKKEKAELKSKPAGVPPGPKRGEAGARV
jgi:beta-lactamase regulating signal transducer with metallopeptidase domain